MPFYKIIQVYERFRQPLSFLYRRYIHPFLVLTPIITGLIVLYLGAERVPNLSANWIRYLTFTSTIGYVAYVFVKKPILLRFATVCVIVLGGLRSIGYIKESIWNPAGVWLLVVSFAYLAHQKLRQEVEVTI